MATLWGGVTCVDPKRHFDECTDRRLPTEWWEDANKFSTLLGRQPGRGQILLTLAGLKRLGDEGLPTADYDLKFSGEDTDHIQTFKAVRLLQAQCTTPGVRDGDDAVFLCDMVESRRFDLARIPIDAAYNVRLANGSGYQSGTKNSGSAWTWQEIVTDIGTALGLTTAERTLPFTPDGTPEDLSFWGGSAWNALCDVLDRLACAVKVDPATNVISIIRLGDDTDSTADATLADLSDRRVWHGYLIDPQRAWRPEKIQIKFLRRPRPVDGSTPYYSVDITLPGPTEVQSLVFDAAATGGTLKLIIPLPDGSTATTDNAAWSATDAVFIANVNVALDAATGTAGAIVASAIPGVDTDYGLAFTFSGDDYAQLSWPLIEVYSLPTSVTSGSVSRTTRGGNVGVVSGSYVQLDDDLAALGATGAPSNVTDLETRAQERADDWLRKRSMFSLKAVSVYRDFIPDVATKVLGSLYGQVVYDDRREAMRTQVIAMPDAILEDWKPLSLLPPWYPPDLGGGETTVPPIPVPDPTPIPCPDDPDESRCTLQIQSGTYFAFDCDVLVPGIVAASCDNGVTKVDLLGSFLVKIYNGTGSLAGLSAVYVPAEFSTTTGQWNFSYTNGPFSISGGLVYCCTGSPPGFYFSGVVSVQIEDGDDPTTYPCGCVAIFGACANARQSISSGPTLSPLAETLDLEGGCFTLSLHLSPPAPPPLPPSPCSVVNIVTFNTPGDNPWTAPTTGDGVVAAWGSGGNGGPPTQFGGGGGGGGGCGAIPWSFTFGETYNGFVASGGGTENSYVVRTSDSTFVVVGLSGGNHNFSTGGTSASGSGLGSSGGNGGNGNNASGPAGSVGTSGNWNGGTGGTGGTGPQGGGGGGGGGGFSDATGTYAGGNGGNGGNTVSSGSSGNAPGGAGGGAGGPFGSASGGVGADGRVMFIFCGDGSGDICENHIETTPGTLTGMFEAWFAFGPVPNGSTVTFTLSSYPGIGTTVNLEMYEGSCDNLTPMNSGSHVSPNTTILPGAKTSDGYVFVRVTQLGGPAQDLDYDWSWV